MPVLVLTVSEDLDKLLKDGRLAAIALLGKLRRVVVVTINIAVVLVVAIRGAKDCRAQRARKMVDVVLSVQRGDVRAAQGAAALKT
jgi:hypothetical protein